jgi:DNA (cytosine-5)-methyltransferase 1
MTLTHAGLFEGYGGTTMAAEMVLGPLETLWVSEIKPAACTLLAHRKPGVRNLGDMRLIHAARHGRIDVMTASWPCQPHSSAGKRLGEADPRALWPYVAHHIRAARPAIFLGENVARITSNGELRRVVRSLAALGYVGAWRVQRASDAPVYGCHQRARCFVAAVDPAAYAAATNQGGWVRPGQALAGATTAQPQHRWTEPDHGDRGGTRRTLTLLPTPTQSMTTGAGTSGRDGGLNLQTAVQLLPTPNASDGGGGVRQIPDQRTHGGKDHGPRLRDVAPTLALLPTPTVADARNGRNATAGRSPGQEHHHSGWTLSDVAYAVNWGPYAESIARWGANFDREAPPPTQLGRNGKPQLAPGFVEWMQGLPEDWVTGVPGLTRNQQLSLLGDGVMPQQGAAAFRFLLTHLAQRLVVAA